MTPATVLGAESELIFSIEKIVKPVEKQTAK
jgi:hypothetical protein